MSIEAIKDRLCAIPALAAWPEIAALLDRKIGRQSFNCWDYPGIAARAAGGETEHALPAAASIYCALLSIHLVDDLLDEDPRGLYHSWGVGKTANIAVALQAAAAEVLAIDELSKIQVPLQRCLARMCFSTAWGQQLDADDRPGEERYWETIRLKTPPLFTCGLEMGALLGGATLQQSQEIAALGLPIGEMVQINDDLHDALEVPACPDWYRQGGNLAILYARLAPHPDRERFEQLRQLAGQEEALRTAQDLLIKSGSVSYCAYALIEAYKRSRKIIDGLAVADTAPLAELVESHIAPLLELLRSLGVQEPESLLRS